MNQGLKDTLIGGAGIGATEVAGNLDQIESGFGLVMQIIIGIVTLVKLFKKKKTTEVQS